MSSLKLAADGEEWDEQRGPESQPVRRRRDVIGQGVRTKTQYRKASEALKDHALYRLTGKLKISYTAQSKLIDRKNYVSMFLHNSRCCWTRSGGRGF